MPNGLYSINGLASAPVVYTHRALWDPVTTNWVWMNIDTMVISVEWPSGAKVKPEKGVVVGTKESIDETGKKAVVPVILWPTKNGKVHGASEDPFVESSGTVADLATLSILTGDAGPAIGTSIITRREVRAGVEALGDENLI